MSEGGPLLDKWKNHHIVDIVWKYRGGFIGYYPKRECQEDQCLTWTNLFRFAAERDRLLEVVLSVSFSL